MFTGIIKDLGCVSELMLEGGEFKIKLSLFDKRSLKNSFLARLTVGDSVALDGVCLTIERFYQDSVLLHLGKETLNITQWNKQSLDGRVFNLEPPLKWGDIVGGHILHGHVEAMAKIEEIENQGKSSLWRIKIPQECRKYFWKKSFIALNGVSLTVNELKGEILCLCIIPHTYRHTNFQFKKLGDTLTFEIDPFVKTIVNSMKSFAFHKT